MNFILSEKQKHIKSLFVFSLAGLLIEIFTNEANACAVCFGGDPTQPQIKALQYGVFIILGIVFCIFACFIKFFLSFTKRATEN